MNSRPSKNSVATVSTLCFGLFLVTVVTHQWVQHRPIQLSWMLFVLLLAHVLYAAIFGVLIGYWKVWQYSAYSSEKMRWQLDIKPFAFEIAHLLLVAIVLVLGWLYGEWVQALSLTALLTPAPVTVWAVLVLAKRNPHWDWARNTAEPLWALVGLSLRSSREHLERERDRLHSEEAAYAGDGLRTRACSCARNQGLGFTPMASDDAGKRENS
ncbi:hypothetical protein [Mycobacteroides chelonae]|uniref:hypothetical protein n=1 Tax=Mycobacteroides chelonae TaxID=1774 RepID=UPI003AAD10B2